MTNKTEIVRARVTPAEKAKAAAVLDAVGLTLSDAFRLLVKRIAAEKALPFEPLVPNRKTVAAMREARRGRLPRHRGSTRDFLKKLDADD